MAVDQLTEDAALVRACREGDERAWAELVERFSRYVRAIAMQAYRLPEHDAEDVFQEVFARTYEHLDTLRDDSAIRPWIAQLTRRLAVDRLRHTARVRADEAVDEWAESGSTTELERLEQAMMVRQAMAELPEICREILDRFFARDQSYTEISAANGVPMGTVASRISRCLSRLRESFTGAQA